MKFNFAAGATEEKFLSYYWKREVIDLKFAVFFANILILINTFYGN